MLEIQSSSRGKQKFFLFIQKKINIYFVLKKYRQVSAIFTDTDTTSRYHKNRPIPILKYRYICGESNPHQTLCYFKAINLFKKNYIRLDI